MNYGDSREEATTSLNHQTNVVLIYWLPTTPDLTPDILFRLRVALYFEITVRVPVLRGLIVPFIIQYQKHPGPSFAMPAGQSIQWYPAETCQPHKYPF